MVKPGHAKNMITQRARNAARALWLASGGARTIFITHSDRAPDPLSVVEGLPPGSIVICRDYDHCDRRQLATSLRAVTRARRQIFLVAGDVALARTVRADGVHLPEYMLRQPCPRGFRFVTAACHSRAALKRAADMGVDMAIVSPVFPTRSHEGAPTLGVHRFSRLIQNAGLPVAALGGVKPTTAKKLHLFNLAGVAAIDGFL